MNLGVSPLKNAYRRPNIEPRVVFGRFDLEFPRKRRGLVAARIETAIGLVRAVMETLSYLHEPRIRPPRRLPPARR